MTKKNDVALMLAAVLWRGLWIKIHLLTYISYRQLSQYSPGLFAVGGTVLAVWMFDEICDGANFMQLGAVSVWAELC